MERGAGVRPAATIAMPKARRIRVFSRSLALLRLTEPRSNIWATRPPVGANFTSSEEIQSAQTHVYDYKKKRRAMLGAH
jgi:hypothetical protein